MKRWLSHELPHSLAWTDDSGMKSSSTQEASTMSDLAQIIDNAAELLDASRDLLDSDDFDHRRNLIDEARAPRVAYMTRMQLVDDALEGLTERV